MTDRFNHALLVTAAVAGMAVATQANAASHTDKHAVGVNPLSANVHYYRFGYEALHMNRAEHVAGKTLDSNKGWINGINFSGLYVGQHLYLSTGINYGGGSVHYNGGVEYRNGSGGIGTHSYQTNMDEQLLTMHGDIGPDFHLMHGRDAIAPFVGFGYRYHYDHTSAGTVNISGLGTFSVPATSATRQQAQGRFGLMDRFQVTQKLGLELKMLGTYSFWGHIQNKYFGGSYKNKWGYVGSVTADYQLTHHFGVYGRASYTRVNTSRVDFQRGAYEPKASNKNTRLEVGVQASF